MSEQEVITLLSGMITKDGKKFARISFTRNKDYAEFIIPDGTLDKSNGFTKEEEEQLAAFVKENSDEFMEKAKEINPMKNWLHS